MHKFNCEMKVEIDIPNREKLIKEWKEFNVKSPAPTVKRFLAYKRTKVQKLIFHQNRHLVHVYSQALENLGKQFEYLEVNEEWRESYTHFHKQQTHLSDGSISETIERINEPKAKWVMIQAWNV